MLRFSRPSAAEIEQFIEDQRKLDLTYDCQGKTRDGTTPNGFGTDAVSANLGTGTAQFANAVSKIKRWEQFDVGWVEVFPKGAQLAEGTVVAILANHILMWSLNACRIVYVIDEPNRFGFGYGTLPDHAEIGEERFLIRKDEDSSEVFYHIVAFSNPRHWWGWMVLPIVRIIQNKFRRDSIKTMIAKQD